MEIGEKTYISLKYTKNDYTSLKLCEKSERKRWTKAIDILEDRLNGRFFKPIKMMLELGANNNAFAIAAIECLLIETLFQFEYGILKTVDNENNYSKFLKELLKDENVTLAQTKRFYKSIRCSILHSAQTKKDSSLNCDKDKTITISGKRLSVNVILLMEHIEEYFFEYKTNLLNEKNVSLRKAFLKKMNYICNN